MSSRQAAIAAIGAALQRYQRSVQSFDDAVGRRLGLGPADLRCLDHLGERPHTAGELATASGLRPAATTALVDRLSAQGLVRRVPSVDDRRRVMVELTEEGEARVGALYGPLVRDGVTLFDDIPVTEIQALEGLLERMIALTDQHRGRVGADPE